MTTQEHSLYEVRADAAWITLNRPQKRNALSSVMVREIYEHLQTANEDPNVRCIVVTGSGKAFCSGMDLNDPPGKDSVSERPVPFHALLSRIWHGDKPVIAAVNGPAFAGGLGIVGACDVVITVDSALFSFSEVRLGLIPAIISVVCQRKLGTHNAMRLMLTGERFSGTEAVTFGLAHIAVPAAAFGERVDELLASLNLCAPQALIECKRLVRAVPDYDVDEGFEKMAVWSRQTFDSPEGQEGMAAFREKRKPNWVTG